MYLLDANTYIQAKNFHYQMSFCPAYWDWLDYQFEQGQLASVELVYDELLVQQDELTDWAKERKAQFLAMADGAIQTQFAAVAQHVSSMEGKKPELIETFLGGADPWLIASAAVLDAVVVTHETRVPDNSRKVKIPNICEVFDVEHITSYELLNRLKAQFVLAD